MALSYRLSFESLLIISTIWIIIALVILNLKRLKSIFLNKVNDGPIIRNDAQRVTNTNRYTINIVYDTDTGLNIDDICDLTISYEKLIKGGYKFIENPGQGANFKMDAPQGQNGQPVENKGRFDGPIELTHEGLSNYVKIKTIKN
jgi:hypothetical protein